MAKSFPNIFLRLKALIKPALNVAFIVVVIFAFGLIIFQQYKKARAAAIGITGTAAVLNTGSTLDFANNGANVTLNSITHQFSGYAWSTDVGWVAFGATDNPNGAVVYNPGTGAISGKARVLNTGADLDFNAPSNVVINSSGTFSGFAWSDDLGWIDFTNTVATFTIPGKPTGATVIGGNAKATISFTAPIDDGGSAITGYTVTSTPGSHTGSGAASPIDVNGLTNGVSYTFTVHATNIVGNSAESDLSNAVIPALPPTPEPEPVGGDTGGTTGESTYTYPSHIGHYVPTPTPENPASTNQPAASEVIEESKPSDEGSLLSWLFAKIVIFLRSTGISILNLAYVIGQSSVATLLVVSGSLVMGITASASFAASSLGSHVTLGSLWLAGLNLSVTLGIKKRKQQGTVYDINHGKNVPGALIQIFDQSTKRLVSSIITDAKGHYSLAVKEGQYILSVVKSGYFFPAKVNSSRGHYVGQALSVREKEEIITAQIPLAQIPVKSIENVTAKKSKLKIKWPLVGLNLLRMLLLLGGTIFIISNIFKQPGTLNIIILFVFSALWINELWLYYCRKRIESQGWE